MQKCKNAKTDIHLDFDYPIENDFFSDIRDVEERKPGFSDYAMLVFLHLPIYGTNTYHKNIFVLE